MCVNWGDRKCVVSSRVRYVSLVIQYVQHGWGGLQSELESDGKEKDSES